MMTTVESDGSFQSRPMWTQGDEFDGTLWFFVSDDGPLARELERNPRVGLSYAAPDKDLYVSVSGRAELVHNRNRADELWNTYAEAWFPEGVDDPHLGLLRVDVEQAQYWEDKKPKVLQSAETLVGAVTGDPSKSGDARLRGLDHERGRRRVLEGLQRGRTRRRMSSSRATVGLRPRGRGVPRRRMRRSHASRRGACSGRRPRALATRSPTCGPRSFGRQRRDGSERASAPALHARAAFDERPLLDSHCDWGGHHLMEARLPAGVVTFLFSDIEGSTRLLHVLGGDYTDALAEHRRLLREAFSAHDGVEVDTQGDAFLVAFARASDAVASAADIQQALAPTGIAVRIGLHTGEPERMIEGYVGLDVHRGARIAHAAHGGQVLLSGATQALVDAPVRDLGRHRLKDLAEPERIFQLEIRGVPGYFPPIRTLEAGSSNLPTPTTSFIGREAELDLIDARLDDPSCRILTLTGPGGAGKTRLAVEAARRRLDRYQHGVYLVPLAAVSDRSLLVPSVANALGFTIDSLWGPGRTPEAQLVDHLSERSMLLVLDNLEHLLDGADLLATIAAAAPDVQLLATSRERLAVAAEWVLEVNGLRDAAIQLFAERARQVDAAFGLNGDTESVRRICRAVEYMPLGVELAAATVRMLGAAALAEEIERDLDAVAAGRRDAPERHRSLRAVFEGSWRCLDDDERTALARLTVLRGAFTREAAIEVAETTLDVLSRLVDKSLVRRTDVRRFEVHELIRQYAAEGLEHDPEAATSTRQRHAEYFCRLLETRMAWLEGREMLAARDELRLERDNLVVAAQRAVVHWPADRAQAVLRALDSFFMVDSWAEGAEVFERLDSSCDRAPGDGVTERLAAIRSWRLAAVNAAERSDAVALAMLPAIRAANDTWALGMVLLALGTNAVNRGDAVGSCRYLEEGRALIVGRDEPTLLCWIDLWFGWAMLLLDEPSPARDMFEEALAAVQTTGSEVNIAFALSKLGIAAEYEGDFAGGLRYHLDAHGRFEHVGDPAGVGYAMSRASVDAYALGAFSDALGYSDRALEAWRSIDHPWGISYSLARAGLAQARLGSTEEARARMAEAYEAARDGDIEYLMTYATAGLGVVLWQEGDAARAASILGSVFADESFPSLVKRHFDGDLDAIHAELGPDRLGTIEARSAGRTPADIAAEVFSRRGDALIESVST